MIISFVVIFSLVEASTFLGTTGLGHSANFGESRILSNALKIKKTVFLLYLKPTIAIITASVPGMIIVYLHP